MKDPTTGRANAIQWIKVAESVDKAGRLFFLRLSLPEASRGAYLIELAALSEGAVSRVIRRTEIR